MNADIAVWLVALYSACLLVVAWSFDLFARRTARKSLGWRTGQFQYHQDHDAWKCPQDQWLWPTAFDPDNRVMRYRGSPTICNSCPVKATCTTSSHGRELTREVDPWPHSEAGRFHRGISCTIAVIALLLPLGLMFEYHTAPDVLVLVTTAVVVVAAGLPLAKHLWNTPHNFPEHIRQETDPVPAVEALIDRYATRWGMDKPEKDNKEKTA